jgi:hypothetical protein
VRSTAFSGVRDSGAFGSVGGGLRLSAAGGPLSGEAVSLEGRKSVMRKVVLAALVVACAVLVVAPAGPADNGGNSENAKLCQKGGYQDWVRADQTPFANVGECVSYAAQGGTLTPPTPPTDRAFCAPAGALTFGQCFIPGVLDFDFDASSGPLGENPTGTFVLESLPEHVEGQVTCLQVTDNGASVGGIVTASTFPQDVGLGFAFTVVDNTAVGADLISFPGVFPLLQPAPPGASTPNCGNVFEPTDQVTGGIVVEDN